MLKPFTVVFSLIAWRSCVTPPRPRLLLYTQTHSRFSSAAFLFFLNLLAYTIFRWVFTLFVPQSEVSNTQNFVVFGLWFVESCSQYGIIPALTKEQTVGYLAFAGILALLSGKLNG